MIEAAGDIPTLPLMTLGPVFVIEGVPASTAKLFAVPSPGAVDARTAVGSAMSVATAATTATAAALEIRLRPRSVRALLISVPQLWVGSRDSRRLEPLGTAKSIGPSGRAVGTPNSRVDGASTDPQ